MMKRRPWLLSELMVVHAMARMFAPEIACGLDRRWDRFTICAGILEWWKIGTQGEVQRNLVPNIP